MNFPNGLRWTTRGCYACERKIKMDKTFANRIARTIISYCGRRIAPDDLRRFVINDFVASAPYAVRQYQFYATQYESRVIIIR